jgi:hypothetical protein
MATPAQIAANCRNAAKSSGPKTCHDKRASSQNAVKHGLTASISSDDIRHFAEIISAEFFDEKGVEDDPTRTLLLLHLAKAEARLERVRKAERNILSRGDADLRLTKDVEMISDILWEDQEGQRRLTAREAQTGLDLLLRVSTAGKANARRTYAYLRRYLREAEKEHIAALRDWLAAQCFAKTNPNSR